ncbi:MAG: DsbA family protein [Myxococcales bacterium]|nr:DsbA family protein [Myxococcales bacterium]
MRMLVESMVATHETRNSQGHPTVPFDYWSDPLCIWAYVAQEKLEHLLALHGDVLTVRYRVVPVFGSVRWRFERGPWAADGIGGRVRKTREIAARFGHLEVTGEVWRTACPESSWSPGSAIKAVGVLEAEGTVAPGVLADYQWRMRERFFVDNRNVGSRAIQLELAEACAVPRGPFEQLLDDGRALALLWEDAQEKAHRGIQGSPTYVFDEGRALLYGNVSARIIEATAEELLSGLEAGCSEC